jgi:hypothetical protein
MSFMEIVFLFLWIYVIYSIVKERKEKKRLRRRIKWDRAETKRADRGKKKQRNPVLVSLPPNRGKETQESFDYEEFRRKLRQSWGLDKNPDETAEKETDEEKESLDSVFADEHVSLGQSSPDEEKNITRKTAPGSGKENPLAEPVSPAMPEKPQKPVKPQASAAVWKASLRKKPRARWSEKDVQQWMIYDAVLGRPRCQNPYHSPVCKK